MLLACWLGGLMPWGVVGFLNEDDRHPSTFGGCIALIMLIGAVWPIWVPFAFFHSGMRGLVNGAEEVVKKRGGLPS